jgi:hypothetical protein
VFVKLQPYVQTRLAHRVNQKLSFHYFGPFEILQRIHLVAYKLQLLADSTVHPVFHVSQLKLADGSTNQVSAEIPDTATHFQYSLKILQCHCHHHNDQFTDQILFQWSAWPVGRMNKL